jgi:predicted phosphodiesterase
MRIRILSDLHREFGPTEIPQEESDLIILAGDIGTKQNALPWLTQFCGVTPTAYVCGNHEFYGDKLPRVTERLKEATRNTNIHVLEDSFFTLGDWHIYGCTLWTDMALQGGLANRLGAGWRVHERLQESSKIRSRF